MMKQRKDAGICRDKKERAAREKITIQLEEINQKVLAKEGRLKKYTNNRMQKKPNDFGQKYGNQKKYNEKAE